MKNMKRDALEKFIIQNREAFDDAVPGPQLWNRLEKELPQPKIRRINIWKITSAAAVALLLVCIGVIIGMNNNGSGYEQSEAWAEYQEAENYYSTQVNQKLDQLKKYDFDPVIEEDIKQLDDIYGELKNELIQSDHPDKETIIDAMIINYQTKISILERVLEKMEEHKNSNSNETEQSDL